MKPTRSSVRPRLRAAHLLWAAAFVWIFAAIYHPVMPAADPGLDASYSQALGIALLRGFVFGRDLVFTYGPLAYFWVPPYQPELFAWHFAWELVLKSLQAIIVVRAVFAWTSVGSRLLVLSCVLVSIGVSHDATALVTIVAGVLVLTRRPRPAPAFAAVVVLACALLSLQKATLLVLSIVAFGALAGVLVLQHRRREAIAYAAGFVACFAAIWLSIGQPISALPEYLWGSWQITRGYSAAMSTAYDPAEQRIALMALAVAAGLVVAGLARRRTLAQAVVSALVLASLLVAWKAGFVRSLDHTKITFAFVVLSPLWIGSLPSPSVRLRGCGAVVMVGLGVWGFAQTHTRFEWARSAYRRPMGTWRELSAPLATRSHLEQALAQTRRVHALPRIRARVGDASIDALPWGLGVLFLNDLDWRPRPVFQSYAAYTAHLSQRNVEHFRSSDRPRFVLVHEGAIDGRHPLHDDGEAWVEILRRYEPVLYEEGYLLFEEKGAAPADGVPVLLVDRTVRWGERLDLTGALGDACWVRLDVEVDPTAWGALRTLLYRGAGVHLDTWFGRDEPVRHRIVPGVAEQGFLISPAAYGMATLLLQFEGVELAPPSAIALDVRHRDRSLFEPTARLRVYSLDDVIGRDCDAAVALGGFPGLPRAPDAVTPGSALRHYAGPPRGLLAHAPSELGFDLAPGRHRLRLRYGIGEGAYTRGATDGVVFSASLVEADGADDEAAPQRLFERHLRPVSVEADRGVQSFEETFVTTGPARLVLETGRGPANHGDWDWSVWVEISIEEIAND